MSGFIDITGQRFGRLTAISRSQRNGGGRAFWFCRCECGKDAEVESHQLRKGITKSCGCITIERLTKHRLHDAPEYQAYHDMIRRCYRPKHRNFKDYGGRGITVCNEWRNDFLKFYADMGPRPTGTSLDRRDNSGHYSPDNCRWATRPTQSRNMRSNIFLTFEGRSLCVSDWARELGIHKDTIRYRLKRQWSIEAVLGRRAA